ncbi:L-asparaginase [Cristinia sonorae]|uniref:asparaginase n=1 Tax=Cristinia sonorae TaxID=1940300 RepID=A0A8K0UY16_9AGAR|nr:L-asparaginase [Cristinia sonorae]
MELSQPSDESKVLVIYTGGTIGMLVGQQGYVPEPYFLTETLRSQHRFHDPLEESLFSHAASVEGFREWSSQSQSGRDTPTSPVHEVRPPVMLPDAQSQHPKPLLVRSSRPIGELSSLPTAIATGNNSSRNVLCAKIADNIYESLIPSLVTPRTATNGSNRKRIRYAILEWNPLLDSSNMEIDDWIRIATEIELNYATFDAFVVLHGTDTMSYTSSALSFLLEDLGKTVIVTGAQIPLSQLRNDAVDNLLGALTIAGHYIIPECCLFFNHTLYRGNRVSKFSSNDFNAFSSPNFPPLVNVGIDITVNWSDVIRQTSLRRFRAHKAMNSYVATLRLFPGITATTVRAFLMPPTQGVVLETFGAGNAPQRADLMSALKEACDRGVVIVAISQCAKGSVSAAYETGRSLLSVGVVSGGDMTPEGALTKLAYLLGKPELSTSQVRSLISTPLRGEISQPSIQMPSNRAAQANTIDDSLVNIQGLLSQAVRLSTSRPQDHIPKDIGLTANQEGLVEATAPWSWTAADASLTEISLLPFLMNLAAAKDDVEAIKFCLSSESSVNTDQDPENQINRKTAIRGGVVNCIDPASGRSPLHVAALNGSVRAIESLLEAGALVHLRDSLGHTALYYAARQGHESAVDLLNQAGANLGGSDIEGGFAALITKRAVRAGDERSVKIWEKTGVLQ